MYFVCRTENSATVVPLDLLYRCTCRSKVHFPEKNPGLRYRHPQKQMCWSVILDLKTSSCKVQNHKHKHRLSTQFKKKIQTKLAQDKKKRVYSSQNLNHNSIRGSEPSCQRVHNIELTSKTSQR